MKEQRPYKEKEEWEKKIDIFDSTQRKKRSRIWKHEIVTDPGYIDYLLQAKHTRKTRSGQSE